MAPNSEQMDASVDDTHPKDGYTPRVPQATPRKFTIVYSTVVQFLYYHIAAMYGLYLCSTSVKWSTILFNVVLYIIAELGVTVGAHRLWAHRAFKAKLPLQILLMLFNSMASMNTVCHWARDHRLHHKYNDTDADPYNSSRGLFYSHVGWLMVKKHPDILKKSKNIDMSDLYGNPVLQFQNKYYFILSIMLGFVLPTLIPMYYWQETMSNAYHVSLLRFVIGLNAIFFVNSIAHAYGNKPYDKNISATQNVPLSVLSLGESYHNFHHVFPFDYRSSELGNSYVNFGTNFIDFFVWIGWAYDLREATEDMISHKAKRTGDGTDYWGRIYNEKLQ